MSRKTSHDPLPSLVHSILLDGFIERIFTCVKPNDDEKDGVEEGAPAPRNRVNEWMRAAIVIDRIAFVVYVIFFICMGFCHYI